MRCFRTLAFRGVIIIGVAFSFHLYFLSFAGDARGVAIGLYLINDGGLKIHKSYTYSQKSYLRIRWAGCVHFVYSDDERFDAHGVGDTQIFPKLPSFCDGQLELLLWRWHNQNYSVGLLKEKSKCVSSLAQPEL